MILEGNQRGGAKQMADHLLKVEDNEHVEVHEVSGFLSDNVHGALREIDALSRGTQCRQFMFSLSLNPPRNETVPVEYFEKAIEDAEKKLGLTGQPRVVVFHEKEGRRHAHCIWSRINANEMKAINLPHYKLKLQDISKQLYLQYLRKLSQLNQVAHATLPPGEGGVATARAAQAEGHHPAAQAKRGSWGYGLRRSSQDPCGREGDCP